MKRHGPGDPARVAEAVADRRSVDWEQESSGDGRIRRILENLRVLDAIGTAHETLQGSGQSREAGVTEILDTEEIPAAWGHLRILHRIGEGSYGEVFLAEDANLKQNVALKLLRPHRLAASDEDGLMEEARKLARVRHPGVLTVHGADRIDGRVGIWTEHIDGRTLEQLLLANGPFGPEEAAQIGIALCGALAGVHAAGLVHGDVKTTNVMRAKGGRIVLMDFSSASDRPRSGGEGGFVAGTPLFMAPEAFQGRMSPAADLYSLGVVLYRLVSGDYPVRGTSSRDVEEKHRAGERVPLRDACARLPRAFVQVVERALSPDPGERYASAGEMERALAAFQGRSGEPAGPSPPFWRTWRARAAAAAVPVALVLAWLLWPRPFEAEAHLFRAGDRAEERLRAGSRIAPGDQLFLEIEGNRDMHVYVFNEDQSGRAVVLFPLEGLDLENPLPGDTRHRLPGDVEGVPNYWNVTSAGGSDIILVVASQEPLREVESTLGELAHAGEVKPVPLTAELEQLRGIAGISPREADDPEERDDPLSGIREGLGVRAGNSRDLWVWEMRLSNPSP